MSQKYRETGGMTDEPVTASSLAVDSLPEDTAIERYKLRILQENARDGGFALLMACISYAALLVNYIDATLVMPWLMVSVAIVATRFTLIARYFNSKNENKAISFKRTVAFNVLLLGMLGMAFGIAPLLYGTDNHLMLIDLRSKGVTGKVAEKALVAADITVNKNMVPFDDQSPFITSGIRVGTPAITTRGLKEDDMEAVVELIDEAIKNYNNESHLESIADKVNDMMSGRPLFNA